jgi:hypothetical protein
MERPSLRTAILAVTVQNRANTIADLIRLVAVDLPVATSATSGAGRPPEQGSAVLAARCTVEGRELQAARRGIKLVLTALRRYLSWVGGAVTPTRASTA